MKELKELIERYDKAILYLKGTSASKDYIKGLEDVLSAFKEVI
jgi:hypothetical protein